MRARRVIDAEKALHRKDQPNLQFDHFYDETAFQQYYNNQPNAKAYHIKDGNAYQNQRYEGMRNGLPEGKSSRNPKNMNKQRLIRANPNIPTKRQNCFNTKPQSNIEEELNGIILVPGINRVQQQQNIPECLRNRGEMERKKSKGVRVRLQNSNIPNHPNSGNKVQQLKKKRDQGLYEQNWERDAKERRLKSNERRINIRYDNCDGSEDKNELRSCASGSINNDEIQRAYAIKASAKRVNKTRITRVDPARYQKHSQNAQDESNLQNFVLIGKNRYENQDEFSNDCGARNNLMSNIDMAGNYKLSNRDQKENVNFTENSNKNFFKKSMEAEEYKQRMQGNIIDFERITKQDDLENSQKSSHQSKSPEIFNKFDQLEDSLGKKSDKQPEPKFVEFTKVIPFGINESNLQEQLSYFMDATDSNIANTLGVDVNHVIKNCMALSEPRVIALQKTFQDPNGLQQEEIIGICLYYIETNQITIRRCHIGYMTVLGQDNQTAQDDWIEKATSHIFTQDQAQEIFISQYHHEDPTTNKLAMNREVSNLFKNRGYKWKQQINNALTGKRTTVMFITRDSEKYGETSKECLELIKFISASIFSDYRANESVWISKSQRDFKSPNDRQYIVLSGLLNYLNYDTYHYDTDKLEAMGSYGSHILQIRNIEDFKFEQCFKENIPNNDVIENSIKDLFSERRVITQDFDEKIDTEEPKSLINYSQLAYRIKNMMSEEIGGIKYIRTNYTKRTIMPKSQAPIFQIPTCDPEVSLIIVQFASERSKKFSMNDFLTSQVTSLLNEEDSSEITEEKKIWLPQFCHKGNYTESDDIIKQFGDQGTGDDIDTCSYLKTAIVKAQLEISSPIYEDRIRIEPKEDDIMINGDFLIGIINHDLLQCIKIPLFTVLVQKKEFSYDLGS